MADIFFLVVKSVKILLYLTHLPLTEVKSQLGLGWILFWWDTGHPADYNAGYLANVRYPANYRISDIKNQQDIRYPDSFNIRYTVGY